MIMRATLHPRKDRKVDLVFDVVHDGVTLFVRTALALAIEDHSAAGAWERVEGGEGWDSVQQGLSELHEIMKLTKDGLSEEVESNTLNNEGLS